MDRDAGEISELAQNRLGLLALVTLPTLAEETPLQLVLRGAQHDQLYQLSSSGVTKVSALPDSLTTPLGSLWKLYVYAWL